MAVVDSSVLIHLARIGRLELLRRYFGKVKITPSVLKETTEEEKIGSAEIKKSISKWIIIEGGKSEDIEGLEKADTELISLAEKNRDLLITNDLAIISVCRSKGIKTMWITTFILALLRKQYITKKEAKEILHDLVNSGLRLSIEVYTAIEKEIENY